MLVAIVVIVEVVFSVILRLLRAPGLDAHLDVVEFIFDLLLKYLGLLDCGRGIDSEQKTIFINVILDHPLVLNYFFQILVFVLDERPKVFHLALIV